MKLISILVAATSLTVFAALGFAHSTSDAAAGRSMLSGEVVDTGCYLGHASRGAKHVECANKCIANGMPMGLLTKDGTLYLITLNHDNADPYNRLKNMAGQTVSVKGMVMTRGGMKAIDVDELVSSRSGK